MTEDELKSLIKEVPDFPKPGISFKDITTLLKSPWKLKDACRKLGYVAIMPYIEEPNVKIAAIESRGFIFGSMLSMMYTLPLVLIRKPGKLPNKVVKVDYGLEYGKDSLELQVDDIQEGDKIILIDDVLATGGSIQAAIDLIEQLNGEVIKVGVLIELSELNAREKLKKYNINSLATY
jgi:adenine phosphoribosyltransferase